MALCKILFGSQIAISAGQTLVEFGTVTGEATVMAGYL